MSSKGSLSTILAGILILIAMSMALIVVLSIYSLILTLSQTTTTHIQRTGELESIYSGLIINNGQLTSSKGPITIIGEITGNGFNWINETTTTYTTQTNNPALLLTNVGPIFMDPQENQVINGDISYASMYLYHWVNVVVTITGTSTGQGDYSGIVLESPSGTYYLLRIDPNYVVGPLTNDNFQVTKDYGMGPQACINFYNVGLEYEGNIIIGGSNCPVPVPGPIQIGTATEGFSIIGPGLYYGYWPSIKIIPVNGTAAVYVIDFYNGTFYDGVDSVVFNILSLSNNMPQWINITCNVPPGVNASLYLKSAGDCAFKMHNNTIYALINNIPNGEYYLIMIINFHFSSNMLLSTGWFIWQINGDNAQYPNWLMVSGTPAQYEPSPHN